jgi:heme/copper-type cytochrome/quinol oxidase subunit 3
VVVPLVLALVLAATSVPMQLASASARAGRLGAARSWILLALVVQTGYFAYQVHDFADQLRVFDISTNAYSSIYYTLLGADHGHVALGLLLNLWLLWKLAGGLTRYRVRAVQAVTWYWHAVNILTLVVTGTLLSAAVG